MRILNKNTEVKKVSGRHVFLYFDEDVNDVSIVNQSVVYISNGIGGLFPRLKQLEVISSGLKFIKRINFERMTHLRDLRLDRNEIEIIFSDTFWDLRNLVWLSMSGNKIKSLTEGLTLRMPNLLWLTANDNEIEVCKEKYFRRNRKIEMISLRNNKLNDVKMNFRKFPRISYVDMRLNPCVNNIASKKENPSGFVEIQSKINTNCSHAEVDINSILLAKWKQERINISR